MEDKLRSRKKNRLDNFDYSSCGAYFITVCTLDRQNYFWDDVGASIARPQDVVLSDYGKIVDEAINNISRVYPAVKLKYYVIMPDHIHILIEIYTDENGRPMVAPTVSRIVQQMKGYVTKRVGFPIWQKLFFDHIIRNERDYEEHVRYIYENPLKWQFENLHCTEEI